MNNPNLTLNLNAISPQNNKDTINSIPSLRAVALNRSQFILELKNMLGMEFIKDISTDSITIFLVNRARIRDVANYMKNKNYRFASLILTDFISYFELNYVFHYGFYIDNSQIIIQTHVDRTVEIPTISDYFPSASYQETQASHRVGAIFSRSGVKNQPELNTNSAIDLSLLCVPATIQIPSKIPNPTLQGIFHPIHKQQFYFDLNVIDGIIQKVELADGWLYKNIHSKLESRNVFNEADLIFEEISSNSNVHLSLAYYQALENIMEKRVPNKARYIRMALAELERIRSHLIWFTNLAYLLGYSEDYCRCLDYLKEFEIQNEKSFKSKNLKNTIRYGGSCDIAMHLAGSYLRFLKDIGNDLFDHLLSLTRRNFTIEKSKGIGIISTQNALEWGLSGPSLRATGFPFDYRLSNTYLSYIQGDFSQAWNVVAFKGGDALARMNVRLWELRESIELSKNILSGLSNYEIPLQLEEIPIKSNLPDDRHAFQTVESPQGALSIYLRSLPKKSNNVAYTVRIMTPDVRNYAAIEQNFLVKEEIRNLPVILHSLDINYHLVDL